MVHCHQLLFLFIAIMYQIEGSYKFPKSQKYIDFNETNFLIEEWNSL